MDKDDDKAGTESRTPEAPQISKDTWYALAVAGGVIAFILAVIMAIWVFSAISPKLMVQRAQALTPFGVAMVAAVTFCTVVWRGLLTDEQVKEQRRQNNAKDDEMLAKLLVDGVGLIEADGNGKRLAGISVLQTVATAPSDRYAGNAMDILLTFFEHQSSSDNASHAGNIVREALAKATKMGRRANISIWLNESVTPENEPPPGAQFIGVIKGRIDKDTFARLDRQTKWHFSEVQFADCSIEDGSWIFSRCEFFHCWFERPPLHFVLRNEFIRCDFSGSRIDRDQLIDYVAKCGSLKAGDNYCSDEDLPISKKPIDWRAEFHCLDSNLYHAKPR